MKDFVIAGECLVELSRDDSGRMQQGFAGDVYSVAVYLKRSNPGARVRLLCAIGEDPFSDALVASLEREGVDTGLMLRHPQRHIGLYAIHNAADGERSFIYWRGESAARQTLALLGEDPAARLGTAPDCFYLSGISLAVLEAETPGRIWPLLQQLRETGASIVFDTNYRPALWPDADSAARAFERALRLSDLVLPGIEDLQLLYGDTDAERIGEHLASLGVAQMVLKDGAADIRFGPPTAPERHPVHPVERVVDTTAAGDSFSGAMLGSLSRGEPLASAVAAGAALSARVIQHRGAILPRDPD